MFDIGFLEILVVAVTALLVLGPERLPVVIRQLASWTARSRHFASQLKEEFEREANLSEMRASLEKQKKEFEAQVNAFQSELHDIKPELNLKDDRNENQKNIPSKLNQDD